MKVILVLDKIAVRSLLRRGAWSAYGSICELWEL